MKILLTFLCLFISFAFATEDNMVNHSNVIIDVPYNMQKRNLPMIIQENNSPVNNPNDEKHLPWSMTQKRIEYDNNGHAQYLPYSLTDLNLQY